MLDRVPPYNYFTRLKKIDDLRRQNPEASKNAMMSIFRYTRRGNYVSLTPETGEAGPSSLNVLIGFDRMGEMLVGGDIKVSAEGLTSERPVVISEDGGLTVEEKRIVRQPGASELRMLELGISLVESDLRRQNPSLN